MKFADMYPKDRFYAAEFNGKPVTLTFRAKDPVTTDLLGKGGPSEKMLPVWHFEETPKKMPAVVTNGVCARAMFGDESDAWGGHKITLYPEKDPSGMSDDGLCIRVKGSPELDRPLVFTAQIGRTKKTFTMVPTGKGRPPHEPVNAETGEVDEGLPAQTPASPTETGQNGDAGVSAAPHTPPCVAVPETPFFEDEGPGPEEFGMDAEEARRKFAAKDAAGPKANALLVGKLKVAGERAGKYEFDICADADARYGISDLKELSKRQAEAMIAEYEGQSESLLGGEA